MQDDELGLDAPVFFTHIPKFPRFEAFLSAIMQSYRFGCLGKYLNAYKLFFAAKRMTHLISLPCHKKTVGLSSFHELGCLFVNTYQIILISMAIAINILQGLNIKTVWQAIDEI